MGYDDENRDFGAGTLKKKKISGVVQNISTNPFQTVSKKRARNSTVLSFDISFDVLDEDGGVTHVWFNRSFRLPPPLEDGDFVEIVGRYGRLGIIGRKNFYAIRIIDKRRNMQYTPWRNRELPANRGESGQS